MSLLGALVRGPLRRAALPWRLAVRGRGVRLAGTARVYHPERVALEDGVVVGADAYLIGNTPFPLGVRLGPGAVVGPGSYLSATGGWIEVGYQARLGRGVVAYGNGGLWIGAGAELGDEVAISTIGHGFARADQAIRLQPLELAGVRVGDGARIGAGAVLLPGVRVGAGAVVEPGSVVTRSVPSGRRVAGVPAREGV